MVVARSLDSRVIQKGDTWRCVTARGVGEVVRIRAVGTRSVTFEAAGHKTGHRSGEKRAGMPIEIFLARYTPANPDLIVRRQEELRLAEKRGDPPLPSPIEIEIDDDDEALLGEAFQIVDLNERRPAPVAPVADPPQAGGRPRKLTGELAREIFELCRLGVADVEVAQAYELRPQMVRRIRIGESYAWATGALVREGSQAPSIPPEPEPQAQQPEEETVAQQPSPPVAPVPPTPIRTDPMLADAADALELLLQFRGQPIPKFLTLDVARITLVIAELRARAES